MGIKGCIQMNKRMKPLALFFIAFVPINSSLFSFVRSEPLVPGEEQINSIFDSSQSLSPSLEDHSNKLISELNSIRTSVNQNSRKLSLAQCLKEGIQNNHQLASAYATIQQYEYSLIATKRGFFPSISLSSLPPFLGRVYTSNTSSSQINQTSVNPNGTFSNSTSTFSSNSQKEYTQFAPYLTVSWSFFQPSLSATISSANASLIQQRLAFDVSARSAILDLQQSYFKLQSSASLIKSFENIYLINLEQVKYVEARQKAGLIDIGAVDQAKSQLYSQASELIGYYKEYLNNSSVLALAMNAPGDVTIVPSDDFTLVGEWDEPISETIDHALVMREEIKEFIESANSSIWSARAAIRSYLPELMLEGIASSQYKKGSSGEGVSFRSQSGNASIGLGITWDIFDGGVKAAEASSYRSSAKSDQQKAEYTKDKIKQQIRQAYSIYTTSAFALHNAHLNLSASTNSIKVNKSRFSVGLGDITSIVQSMQLLGEATRQYNQAILNHNTSVAELYRYSATWPDQTESIVLQTADKLSKDD